jgi:transcriptional regulator with XRE-family HTH domain
MEKTQYLGQIIQQQRKRLGLTLRALSKKSGVSLSYLSRIELDERYPSILIIHKIARPLKLDEKDLLNLAGYLPDIESKNKELEKHKSIEELDILLKRVTADLQRIKNLVKVISTK